MDNYTKIVCLIRRIAEKYGNLDIDIGNIEYLWNIVGHIRDGSFWYLRKLLRLILAYDRLTALEI